MKNSNMRRCSRSIRIACAVACGAASFFAAQSASAQTPVNTWTGAAADNLWVTGGNWSQGSPPDISLTREDDAVFPDGLGALSITIPLGQKAGRLTFQNTATTNIGTVSNSMTLSLRYGIDMQAGAGAVSLTHGSGTAETINTNGDNQSIINNSSSLLHIARNVGNLDNAGSTITVDGSGPITLGGGFSDRVKDGPQPTTNVIKNGTGTLEMQAGTFQGTFTMNSGVLRVRSSNAFGTTAKTVTVNGGTISAVNSDRVIPNVVSWVIAADAGFGGFGSTLQLNGPVDLSGAVRTFDVGTLGGGSGNLSFVGEVSNGGVIKTGPNTITSNSLSTYADGTTVNAGALQWVNNSNIVGGVITTGPFGTGTVTINDGASLRSNPSSNTKTLQNNVVVNGNVTLGGTGGSATALIFNSTDGTDALTTPSTFTLGTTPTLNVIVPVTVANAVVGTGGLTKTGAETLDLTSNSNSYSGDTVVQEGTLQMTRIHSGTAVTIETGTTLKVVDSSPTLPAHPAGDDAQVSQPKSLTVNGTGVLDLGNNDMIISYGMGTPYGGTSPAAAIEALIAQGFNAGDWLGTGITSSAAASVDAAGNFVLGIADNATLPQPYGMSNGGDNFAGIDVPVESVLVKFTHRADINLDGLVTDADAILFSTNYEVGAPATWSIGDLDYDGVFSDNDAIIFGTYYDTGLAHLPEPASLGVLGMAAAGLLARRRRA